MKYFLPEQPYVQQLVKNLIDCAPFIQDRPLTSIFFGGGTPSLFSATSLSFLLEQITKHIKLSPQLEITLEANPGTIDEAKFRDYYLAGINRLSLGVQSLQNDKLKLLGRIHDHEAALRAIDSVKAAGFTNFNIDLMYGLPQQSIADGLADLQRALSCNPTHLSWYQLTIEPNTLFYHQQPLLPNEDAIWEMQQAGQSLLQAAGFQQYEVSAYARHGRECLHNRNYWEFGDYLGIGAGAHSKITNMSDNTVIRFAQLKHPKDFLNAETFSQPTPQYIADNDLIFEFMLNALRLTNGFASQLFTERTGLHVEIIEPLLEKAQQQGLLMKTSEYLQPSPKGRQFLNNLMTLFLS